MNIPRYRMQVFKYVAPTGFMGKGKTVKDPDAILHEQSHKKGGWVKFESVKPLIAEVDKLRFDKQAALTELERYKAMDEEKQAKLDKLEELVLDSFEDGYAKAEARVSRGDRAWEYSHTHDVLREITGKEFYEKEW